MSPVHAAASNVGTCHSWNPVRPAGMTVSAPDRAARARLPNRACCDTHSAASRLRGAFTCPVPQPPVPIALGALDLAALLCSRVCHDLISPVGAIVNGLEVLDEDKDEETRTFALDLIKKSARQASARLQFCRLAFGAAGSAGAQIEMGDAETAAARPP